jgi:hypothetical protein
MTKAVIYAKDDNSLVFVNPNLSVISAYECGRRETPNGVPFLIVDTDNYPEDYDFMQAWEADFSDPDGYGIGREQWLLEADDNSALNNPDPDFAAQYLNQENV